jgi:formamidopyrimidine-DNA glycosylase
MPELPEVETVVRALREPLIGQTITNAVFPAIPKRMINIEPTLFSTRISGQEITAINRRAKYLLFQLSRDVLIVHLKMTGHLYVEPPHAQNAFDRWLRVYFPLAGGDELRFSDSRRFGRVLLAEHAEELLPDLGPEPLDDSFTLAAFKARLEGRSGLLKALLLDQSFVAGVGNIYADEALHISGLHPLRKADTLSTTEIKKLHAAIRQALNDGIAYQGASIGWYRKPDGSKGESQNHFRAYRTREDADRPCPVCGGLISTIRVGGRGTHFCPTCQPAPKQEHKATKKLSTHKKGAKNG